MNSANAFLMTHRPWGLERGALTRTFTLSDFAAAIDFVIDIAHLAERAKHHPDIDIRYAKVKISLVTHDAGNTVTPADTALAASIDELFNEREA